jgi:tetratricopeptide (TPR) repeat protein
MSQLFLCRTAPLLEEDFLTQAERRHRNSSWFRRLWQFDPQRSLQEFRNGLGENAENKLLLDKKEANDLPVENVVFDRGTVCQGSNLSFLLEDENLSCQELPSYRVIQPSSAIKHYQNHISLVLNTINGVSSVCSQDVQTRTLARLLKPHLDHILSTNTSKNLKPKSRAHALSAVAAINSALGNLEASIPSLERAVGIEEQNFGKSSLEVAITLTRLAEVYSSLENPNKARELLERAFGIYDLQRKKSGEYKRPLEFARTVEALGAVYGTLGFKQRSKEYIERALSYMQASAPTTGDEIEGRRFACEVASTLTDLGHAYLSVGDAFSGRKMLELAVTGLKNMYGEEHPEVVRALTVLGTAYTMQGNWQEGKKMRKEAGKLQSKIDAIVAL